jgi:hypothetical protein
MNLMVENHTENHSVDDSKGKFSELSWVQCNGYRCLAMMNADGKWIAVGTGEELTDVIGIYSS